MIGDFANNFVEPVDLSAPAKVALLVIDMQYHDAAPDRGLTLALEKVEPGSMAYFGERLSKTTVPAIGELLDLCRSNGVAVVHLTLGSSYQDLRDMPPRMRAWIRNIEGASGIPDLLWDQNPDFAIIEELRPLPHETVVRKTTNGAFNGSQIDFVLSNMGIESLVVTGVTTSACVETTARDAADRGYGTLLVSDALADYDQELHDATLRAFQLGFGEVARSVQDVKERLGR